MSDEDAPVGVPATGDGPSATDPSTDVSGPASDVPCGEGEVPVTGIPADGDPVGDQVDEDAEGDPVLDVMAVLEAERDGYLLDLQRATAEFANYRRQADRRTAEVGGRARGDLAEKLLPVFDACDLALEHGADDVAPIRASLVQALEPAGLEVLDPVDEPFDPNRHDAVLHEPAVDGDDAGQVVVEVLRRGYAWEGRVLRPAMVRVRG